MEATLLKPRVTKEPNGSTRVELLEGERSISRLWIVPFTLTVGVARVRMDGIGGVGTDASHRKQGLARRVLAAAIERMRAGKAALSMLYGIPDFYPKFGYATAGPDFLIRLSLEHAGPPVPEGWRVRAFAESDLAGCRALYDRATEDSVGAAVREEDAASWKCLVEHGPSDGEDACRVVEDGGGDVAAYVWRRRTHWAVNNYAELFPETPVWGELLARDARAADAALAACRNWVRELAADGEPAPRETLIGTVPGGAVWSAARLQYAEVVERCQGCGGSMARVLDTQRLLTALLPELSRRAAAMSRPPLADFTRRTATGAVRLRAGRAGVSLAPAGTNGNGVRLDQGTLARLALGAYEPRELLERLPEPIPEEAAELLSALFPLRRPYLALPDRY